MPDLINDAFACENDRTLNKILKGELGFQSFVVSDWLHNGPPLPRSRALTCVYNSRTLQVMQYVDRGSVYADVDAGRYHR